MLGHRVTIGASVGGAVAPLDGRSAEALLKAADAACYRCKRDGRGTFGFFAHSMDDSAGDRRMLELWLRTALTKSQLSLHYQPIYCVETGRIVALEALLRWRHPERGPIPPAEFIPIAEESGLIVPIGEWVLRRACLDAAHWPEDVRLTVNLSPIQFSAASDIASTLVSAAATAGFQPSRIELEIAGSVRLAAMDGAASTLGRLRALGARLCMEDFGSEHRSAGYLSAFAFDRVKLDRSLVQGLADEGAVAQLDDSGAEPQPRRSGHRGGRGNGRAAAAHQTGGLRRGAGLSARPAAAGLRARRSLRRRALHAGLQGRRRAAREDLADGLIAALSFPCHTGCDKGGRRSPTCPQAFPSAA